jgi:hypothetical protein
MKLPYIYAYSNLDKAFGVRKLACALEYKRFICKLLKAAASCRTPNQKARMFAILIPVFCLPDPRTAIGAPYSLHGFHHSYDY